MELCVVLAGERASEPKVCLGLPLLVVVFAGSLGAAAARHGDYEGVVEVSMRNLTRRKGKEGTAKEGEYYRNLVCLGAGDTFAT